MVMKKILKKLTLSHLKKLQYPTGLFGAARLSVNTGYDKAWIRDNVYIAIGLEKAGLIDDMKKVYRALLDILLKHEEKIDWAIKEKPDADYKYIHARYCPHNFDEFWENWGNKQNDAIGALLFKIGELEKKGMNIIRNNDDLRIIEKLVDYLESIEYWHDPDNGVWENDEEVHASSVGACVAGLKAIDGIVKVNKKLISKGQETLDALLPHESETKEVDLALLTLIYPYNIVSARQREQILDNIERKLVRENGVIRYFGDWYYNHKGKEAEWVMGFIWLAIIYNELCNQEKYNKYLKKTLSVMNWKGELPELYLGGTNKYNNNTPLGWNHALLLCALP